MALNAFKVYSLGIDQYFGGFWDSVWSGYVFADNDKDAIKFARTGVSEIRDFSGGRIRGSLYKTNSSILGHDPGAFEFGDLHKKIKEKLKNVRINYDEDLLERKRK